MHEGSHPHACICMHSYTVCSNISIRLLQLGVWLRPTELKTLFEAVDQDGGGDVDIGEFESFWNKW